MLYTNSLISLDGDVIMINPPESPLEVVAVVLWGLCCRPVEEERMTGTRPALTCLELAVSPER